MPKMKPGKNQGNIDKKALAKQNGDDTLAQDEFERLWTAGGWGKLDSVDLGIIKNKKTTNTSPQDRRYDRAVDNNADMFGDTIKINDTVSSAGDNPPDIKKDANEELGSGFLFGSRRFNKLMNIYHEVKDMPGIENHPKWHTLINKISRKLPRTVKNIEKSLNKSEEMRAKISNKMFGDDDGIVRGTDEIMSNIRASAQNLLNNPIPEKPKKEEKENDNTGNTNKNQVITTASKRGPYLAPQLGVDIKKSLKNFR